MNHTVDSKNPQLSCTGATQELSGDSDLVPRSGNKVKSTVPNMESLVVPLFEMHYVHDIVLLG